jgi:hypothetical protein
MTETTTPDLLTQDALNTAVADLTRAGVTNSDTATRIARALAETGFTPTDLPTSTHGACATAIMCKLKYADRVILGDLIARNAGAGNTWPPFLAGAFDQADNEDQINDCRKSLDQALKDAQQAIERVIRVRGQLTGPLFDVEHTEGDNLLPHYIAEAHRAIRTAALVNPTRNL